MDVLYAIMYAKSASSSLKLQSFLFGLTFFSRIDLTNLLEIIPCPFDYVLYGVATL